MSNYEGYTLDFNARMQEVNLSEYNRLLKIYFLAINHENKTIRNVSGPFQCREYATRAKRCLVADIPHNNFDFHARAEKGEELNEAIMLRAHNHYEMYDRILSAFEGTTLEPYFQIMTYSKGSKVLIFKWPEGMRDSSLAFHIMTGLFRSVSYNENLLWYKGIPVSKESCTSAEHYEKVHGAAPSSELHNFAKEVGNYEFMRELTMGSLINSWPADGWSTTAKLNKGQQEDVLSHEEASSLQCDHMSYVIQGVQGKLPTRAGTTFKKAYMCYRTSSLSLDYAEKLVDLLKEFEQGKENDVA